jgi:hypothetical protein
MNHIGREGYRRMAAEVMNTAEVIREGIGAIDGLRVIGRPDMTVMAFTSDKGDIYDIGDALSKRGWYLDRLQYPAGLHMTVNRLNAGMEDEFLRDLREIVSERASLRSSKRATRASVRIVGGLSGILPAGLFDRLTRMAGKYMGKTGSEDTGGKSPGGSQAALYGIHATIRNRKNVKKMVANLLDGIYS